MDKCYKYKVWCNTDSKWEYRYSESDSEASLSCPTNTAHSVDDAKLSITESIEKSIVKSQQILSQDGLTRRPIGFQFTAPKGIASTHYFLIDEAIALRGGSLECENHVFGDSFSFDIEDKDGNVYPAGTVIAQYIKNQNVRKNGLNELQDESISDPIPANLFYIRLKYNSVGTVNDVKCNLDVTAYV